MDLTALHWEQLPTVLAFVATMLGATVSLLLLALPRREVWAWTDGDQSRYRRNFPPEQTQTARRAVPALLAHPSPG